MFLDLFNSFNIFDVIFLIPDYKPTQLHRVWLMCQIPVRIRHVCSSWGSNSFHKWLLEYKGLFLYNKSLFPFKVPLNFKGCTLKGRACIITHNKNMKVHKDEETLFETEGLEYSTSVTKLKNDRWIPHTIRACNIRTKHNETMEVSLKLMDIGTGAFPVTDLVPTYADTWITHLHFVLKWVAPCPSALLRMDRIDGVFSMPFWIS